MTRITSPTTVLLDNNKAIMTVAKANNTASGDYAATVPPGSLVITLVENQTGSSQTITVGDFYYQYLLTANSPLYYYNLYYDRSGPYFVKLRNSTNNVMSILIDLISTDLHSTICVIPNGKYTFGPLD